ncbi:MAG: hypothetical protein EA349_03380 [Halomonadaceae bacterium]|nr:MAG: hypothetical protein EA349_03380 [Halomonadaceae bacterium]
MAPVILLSLLLVVACNNSESQLSLQVLADYQQGYDGRRVVTEGTVRSFDDPLHYWIEDQALNRVAITPDSAVADYVGQRVRVKGVFSASRDAGRVIAAEEVTVQ